MSDEYMQLEKFADSHVSIWQEAIDRTGLSPCPTGGPEYISQSSSALGKVYLLESKDLFLPLVRSSATSFGLFKSPLFSGVRYNSLLGVSEITDSLFISLTSLPKRASYLLEIPELAYKNKRQMFENIMFIPLKVIPYYFVSLPETYKEWLARKGVKRLNIGKAERSGVRIEFGGSEFLNEFYQMMLKSYRRWQQAGKTNRSISIDRYRRTLGLPNGKCQIALAHFNGKVIAATIFCCYKKTAAYLFNGMDYEHRDKKANNLIQAEIIKRLIAAGVEQYNLGSDLGMKGLRDFKLSFGSEMRYSVLLGRHRFPRISRLISTNKLSPKVN